MWTPDGVAFAARAIADRAAPVRLVVSDGQSEASADAQVAVTNGAIVVTADFGEGDAAFEWREQRVVAADGTVLDEAQGDQGRKPVGAIWSVEVTLSLAGE